MLRSLFVWLIAGIFIFGIGEFSSAEHDHSANEQTAGAAAAEAVSTEALNVGNKICPVSKETIDEATKATYEYKGKIYNFCCAACIENFKQDPEKYIIIIDKEIGK